MNINNDQIIRLNGLFYNMINLVDNKLFMSLFKDFIMMNIIKNIKYDIKNNISLFVQQTIYYIINDDIRHDIDDLNIIYEKMCVFISIGKKMKIIDDIFYQIARKVVDILIKNIRNDNKIIENILEDIFQTKCETILNYGICSHSSCVFEHKTSKPSETLCAKMLFGIPHRKCKYNHNKYYSYNIDNDNYYNTKYDIPNNFCKCTKTVGCCKKKNCDKDHHLRDIRWLNITQNIINYHIDYDIIVRSNN